MASPEGNSLQYPCLESLMNTEAEWVAVHGVTKSRARLSDCYSLSTYITLKCIYHALETSYMEVALNQVKESLLLISILPPA